MPFDGAFERLQQLRFPWALEFDRESVTEKLRQPKDYRRGELAYQSLIVLDLVEKLFVNGARWIRGSYQNLDGFCLVGAIDAVRATRFERDRAGVYLSQAINACCGRRLTIEDFNDTRLEYGEIKNIIGLARERARRVLARCDEAMTS